MKNIFHFDADPGSQNDADPGSQNVADPTDPDLLALNFQNYATSKFKYIEKVYA